MPSQVELGVVVILVQKIIKFRRQTMFISCYGRIVNPVVGLPTTKDRV
jgi:hypothetical protein